MFSHHQIMRQICICLSLIFNNSIRFSIHGAFQQPACRMKTVVNITLFFYTAEFSGNRHTDLIIRKIDLYRPDIHDFTQIAGQPFSLLTGCSPPPGLYVFVRSFLRSFSFFPGRGIHLFLIVQQIPLRIFPRIQNTFRDRHRPVSIVLIAEQISLCVKSCRPQSYSSFHRIVDADAHGGCVPEITGQIFQCRTMSCPRQKSARFIGIGTIFCQTKRSQWIFRHITSVTIDIILRAGGSILQIIKAMMFRHPGSLNKWSVSDHASPDKSLLKRRNLFFFSSRFFQKLLIADIYFFFRQRISGMILTDTFISFLKGIS